MPDEGWFTDPTDRGRLRWWNGQRWTQHVASNGRVSQEESPYVQAPSSRRRVPLWGWAVIAVVGILLLIFMWQFVALLALVALITAIVGLAKSSRTWLRFRSRTVAGLTGVAAFALLVGIGATSVALTPRPETVAVDSPRLTSPIPQGSSEPTSLSTPRHTPTPTPEVVVVEEHVTEAVEFDRTTTEDSTVARGQSAITIEGVPGERTLTYRVTTIDGVESDRVLISDEVTTAPIDEVTTVGTYEAPPEPEPDCDPNYAEACVPIASDVDCGGGSGNGPAYLYGVARVVGADIYDLDRDGDGWACE